MKALPAHTGTELPILTVVVTWPCRTETRERRREAKAETAAKLESAIETELLKRLQAGVFGDIYNFPVKQYEAALQQAAEQEADNRQGKMEYVEAESEDDDADQVHAAPGQNPSACTGHSRLAWGLHHAQELCTLLSCIRVPC